MDAAARSALRKSKAAGEADLHPEDILRSMAATLLSDNSAVYHVNTLPDREPPELEAIKKPPKEIFYRKTQLFATRVPNEVGPKRCTCKYLCHGAPAEVKCLSCVMYDPKGLGFFCKMCFDARHPWYRVPHIFEDIAKDETVQHTLKVSHRRAEMVRYEEEGKEMYKSLMGTCVHLWFCYLGYIACITLTPHPHLPHTHRKQAETGLRGRRRSSGIWAQRRRLPHAGAGAAHA